MLVSEKQHTERSSQLPIEEIYSNHDINQFLQYDKSTGYNFDFPSRWANADSTNKVIALRKLDIRPTSHNFNMALRVYKSGIQPIPQSGWNEWGAAAETSTHIRPPFFEVGIHFTHPQFVGDRPTDDASDEFKYEILNNVNNDVVGYKCVAESKLIQYRFECSFKDDQYITKMYTRTTKDKISSEWLQSTDKCFTVTEENSLIEIIHLIVQEFCAFLTYNNWKLCYKYDIKKGSMHFILINKNQKPMYLEFKFITDEDAAEFLRFLNQDLTFENWRKITDHNIEPLFEYDVWDRRYAQFHSAFSDAKRNYIGSNRDDLSHVNKLFKYSYGNTSFNIRFTTDGLNNFLPKYCNFIIELVFILNYKNNIIT